MHRIRRSRHSVLIGCVILLISWSADTAETMVASILANPAQFDGQTVTVRGSAMSVKPTVSRRVNPYTTSQLQDGGSIITVYTRGHPSNRNGDRVEVTGVFQKEKHVGQYTFHNEIDAHTITPR
jgi:hypothetical protein